MWAAIIPPWLAPDEPSHFTYVAHLVENGRIPDPDAFDNRYSDYSPEVSELCVMTLCAEVSRIGGPVRRSRLPVLYDYAPARTLNLPLEQRRSAGGSSASPYPPFYYLFASLFYRAAYSAPIIDRLLASRVASCLLSSGCAVFAYLFAFEVRRSRAWGRSVGLSLALMPMHAFIGSTVNNDAAFFLVSAALCWLMVRAMLAPELTIRSAVALGITSGALLLTKHTSAPLVGMAGLVTLGGLWRSREGHRHFSRKAAVSVIAFGTALVGTAGTWLLFRRFLPGTPGTAARPGVVQIVTGQAQAAHSLSEYFSDLSVRGWPYVEWLFLQTYWGVFGWLEHYMPMAAYKTVAWVLAGGLIGLMARIALRRDERWLSVTWLIMIVGNVALLFLAADYFMAFATRGQSYGMQGRYFFATLTPVLFLAVSGLSFMLGDRPLVLRLVPIGMGALQSTALMTVLHAYYAVRTP
jgi:hypothetical protein